MAEARAVQNQDNNQDARPTRQYQVGTLPSREAILEAMASQPDLDGKRDLAKYFGIHGDMRTPFKVLLKEMEGEGFIARTRKTIRRTATLPQVTVARHSRPTPTPTISTPIPAQWNDDEGEKPRVTRAAAASDARVVPAPVTASSRASTPATGRVPDYTAKPMKILDKPRRGQIGIVRIDEDGARLVPVDRKQKEMRIDGGDLGDGPRRRPGRGRRQGLRPADDPEGQGRRGHRQSEIRGRDLDDRDPQSRNPLSLSRPRC